MPVLHECGGVHRRVIRARAGAFRLAERPRDPERQAVKTKVRETVKVTDTDHHLMEWFEDHRGNEVKTMEISYTRKQ